MNLEFDVPILLGPALFIFVFALTFIHTSLCHRFSRVYLLMWSLWPRPQTMQHCDKCGNDGCITPQSWLCCVVFLSGANVEGLASSIACFRLSLTKPEILSVRVRLLMTTWTYYMYTKGVYSGLGLCATTLATLRIDMLDYGELAFLARMNSNRNEIRVDKLMPTVSY